MRIQLNKTYQGWKTNEQIILPGIYDDNDPALFGCADYLIQNGHAVYVELPLHVEEVQPDPETTSGFLSHDEAMIALGRTTSATTSEDPPLYVVVDELETETDDPAGSDLEMDFTPDMPVIEDDEDEQPTRKGKRRK